MITAAVTAQLDKRKSRRLPGKTATGRGKEEWPPMPHYRNHQVQAVADWMQSHRENRRPLSVAAPLLTIVCALKQDGLHLPTRARLAQEIGCTTDGIDAALSTAIAYGEISERHETIDGAVARRRSTRRLRYIDPSPALWNVWKSVAPQVPATPKLPPQPVAKPIGGYASPRTFDSPWRGITARPVLDDGPVADDN